MMAQLIGAFVMIMIGVMLIPVIVQQLDTVQSSTNVTMSESTQTVLTLIPFFFGFTILLVAIAVVYSALRSSGIVGGRKRGVEDIDDEEEDEDEEDDYEDEDEEEEEETKTPPKKHTAIVTTKKRDGQVKTNINLGPGYNVDKYALDPPTEDQDKKSSLTLKEDNFKKTRFD